MLATIRLRDSPNPDFKKIAIVYIAPINFAVFNHVMTVRRSNRIAQGNLQIYCDNASIVSVNYLYYINALVLQGRKSSQTELTIVTETYLARTSTY